MADRATPPDGSITGWVDDRAASPPRAHILGMRVDHVEFGEAARLIADWAAEGGASRYVCAANVHMTMEAHDDPAFQTVVNGADLVLADGVPMVWGLRALGLSQERRVRVSPDLLYALFDACQERGIKLGLYGGSPETLRVFCDWLAREYPRLQLACAIDPPLRPPTADEDERYTRLIRESGAQLLLVGIGCPKQEKWMAAHAGALFCTMFGVGAAFDLLGGRTKNAPAWMRDRGLEWLYRLALEPRRLWRRHLFNDPRFLVLLARQALRERAR